MTSSFASGLCSTKESSQLETFVHVKLNHGFPESPESVILSYKLLAADFLCRPVQSLFSCLQQQSQASDLNRTGSLDMSFNEVLDQIFTSPEEAATEVVRPDSLRKTMQPY